MQEPAENLAVLSQILSFSNVDTRAAISAEAEAAMVVSKGVSALEPLPVAKSCEAGVRP